MRAPCALPEHGRPFQPQQQQCGGTTRSEGNSGAREQPRGESTAEGCPQARSGKPGAAPHLLPHGGDARLPPAGCRSRSEAERRCRQALAGKSEVRKFRQREERCWVTMLGWEKNVPAGTEEAEAGPGSSQTLPLAGPSSVLTSSYPRPRSFSRNFASVLSPHFSQQGYYGHGKTTRQRAGVAGQAVPRSRIGGGWEPTPPGCPPVSVRREGLTAGTAPGPGRDPLFYEATSFS